MSVGPRFCFHHGKENLGFLALLTVFCPQAAAGLGCWAHHSCTCAEMGGCLSHFCNGLIASEALKMGCGWSKI